MEQADQAKQQVRGVKTLTLPKQETADDGGQSLALRIWEGQSSDMAVIERVARIAAGLKAQGMSLDVKLPHPDATRYMDAHRG